MADKKYPINTKEVEAEYQELAARMNYDGSLYLPRIFKKAFSLEQARVALEFEISPAEIAGMLGVSEEVVESDIRRYQVEAIAGKLKLDEEAVEKHIQYMFELGYAFPTRRGWRWARGVLQLRDSQSNLKYDEQLGDEYFDLWKAFERLEMYPTMSPQVFAAAEESGPRFRIMPSRRSLENISDIVAEDNLEEVLKQASTIAVVHCPCKRLIRDRDPDMPVEVCIICDRIAEHNIRRGSARVISVEEALVIHDMATDAGLVCLPPSNEPVPKMICHCHWSCCGVITPVVMMGYPLNKMIASSCYQVAVDPERCNGCRLCLERCQFGAIQMKPYLKPDHEDRVSAWTDTDKCLGCGLCVTECPAGARTMVMVKTGDSIPREGAEPISYTAEQDYRMGKHVETSSVMTRPVKETDKGS
ncbi:ATP-binding protein [Chloroflexota bacterium]